MWVTGRGASRLLMGVVGSDEQVRMLLRTGIVGHGVPTTGGVLYDERRVEELAARPRVERDDLVRACPSGLYVARVPRHATVDVTASWEDVAAQVGRMPTMPWLTGALLHLRLGAAGGRLPWVATVSGFVVLGADLTGYLEATHDAPRRFRLEPPSDWFGRLERRWLPTGRGGPPWHVWDPGTSGVR